VASNLPPIPQDKISEVQSWREWFRNLGNYIQATQGGTTIWGISQGGTGSSSVTGARNNLGLGSMAVQNSDNVAITGGSVVYNTVTKSPFGSFHDETTQTAAANTITAITFTNTDYSNNVALGSPTSRIVFSNAGNYIISFSIQAANTASAADNITLWIRINGVDVATSAGIVAIPAKHGSINGATVFGWTAFYTFNAGDYMEIMWTTDAGTSSLTTYPVGTAPVHPLSPSAAVSVSYLTNI